MRVFLDTEFSNENLLKAELVSLALASEDGRECYLEREELPLACSQIADCGPIPAIRWNIADDAELAAQIERWFEARPEARRHHALTDARALRGAWMAMHREG